MASVYNNTTLQPKHNIMEKKSHFRSTIGFAAKLLFNPSFKEKKKPNKFWQFNFFSVQSIANHLTNLHLDMLYLIW